MCDLLWQRTQCSIVCSASTLRDKMYILLRAALSRILLQESISGAAGAASSAAEAASANLPEPVRDALAAAKGPVSQAVSQVCVYSPLDIESLLLMDSCMAQS